MDVRALPIESVRADTYQELDTKISQNVLHYGVMNTPMAPARYSAKYQDIWSLSYLFVPSKVLTGSD